VIALIGLGTVVLGVLIGWSVVALVILIGGHLDGESK
jgi:hypothetical protein